jgi:hypothetical protein
MRLRVAPKHEPDAGFDALRTLALALAPHLAELLGAARADDALVDVCMAVPVPKRIVMAACRRGDVAGASRVGRKWLAPRASVDAFVRARGPRAVPSPADAGDDLEVTRRRLAQPGRRRRAG